MRRDRLISQEPDAAREAGPGKPGGQHGTCHAALVAGGGRNQINPPPNKTATSMGGR